MNKYTASEGKVWDYREPHYDEEGRIIHLYAKTIYLGKFDSIDNYIEVDEPEE